MITGPVSNFRLDQIGKAGEISGPSSTGLSSNGPAQPGGFAQVLKSSIDEVSRLQQDASKAVDDLATGDTQNFSGVMTAVEKSDMAFKTLMAIRSKLMDAYQEIKSITV
jgi:flagellar hook-basal body complex protein FliE